MFDKHQIISLQVICNSDKQEIQKIDDNTYKLKVRSPALKGKANKEIFEFFRWLGQKGRDNNWRKIKQKAT